MWYEILPSFAIIVGALTVPTAFTYGFNKLVLGHGYRRSLATPDQRKAYLRDVRLAGDPYTFKGLEAIPE